MKKPGKKDAEKKDPKIKEGVPLSHKQKRALKKMQKRAREQENDDREEGKLALREASGTGEGNKSPKKARTDGGIKVCPAGHTLRVFGTPHDEYMCDATSSCKGGFLKQGSLLFGCRLCDWDACEKCTAETAKTKARTVLKEEEERAKTRAEVLLHFQDPMHVYSGGLF